MAESVKPDGGKKGRKDTREAGIGHNLAEILKKAEPAMKRLFKLQEAMDKDMAGYASDFATAYEEEAEKIGIKKTLLVAEYKRALKNKKQREKEMMMEEDDRQVVTSLREAFKGTPFADFFAGELAKAKAA